MELPHHNLLYRNALRGGEPTHFDISLEVCYTLENNLLHILFERFLFSLISPTCVSHTRVFMLIERKYIKHLKHTC
jgi:hypothetical protein